MSNGSDSGKLSEIRQKIYSCPADWTKSTLGKELLWRSGGTPKKSNSEYYGGDIPWLVIGDLNDGLVTTSANKITALGLKNSSAKIVKEGSVLLAMYGSIGKLGIAGFPLATNQAIAFSEPSENINNRYLFYFLLYCRDWFGGLGKGATQLNISQTVIKLFPFVFPRLGFQLNIVKRIEELFSELDKGIESLKTAREQLKVYRQALLKHAFEGRLTAKWREENADKLETPEQLRARIQQERQARYQQQLESWRQAVKVWESSGEEGRKPAKPKEPAVSGVSIEQEFETPAAWAVLTLGDLAFESVLGKMLDKQKNAGKERHYLGNINVRWGAFDLDSLKLMRIEDSEVDRYALKKGDLVICEGGEPGRCSVWEGEDDAFFIQKALHRVRFTESYHPKFAFYYLLFSVSQERVVKHFTGTTIKHLTGAGLSRIQFPLCSLSEQIEVVRCLEEKITHIEVLNDEIGAQLQKSETLRQSILKKAFSGQLVPQDANAESVSYSSEVS